MKSLRLAAMLLAATAWSGPALAEAPEAHGNDKAASAAPDSKHAGDHEHGHQKDCGHKAETHEGHTDYEHDGHHHKTHGDHVDDCNGPEHADKK
jgi:hypothetical protein